jgi:hypothetical protein
MNAPMAMSLSENTPTETGGSPTLKPALMRVALMSR